MVGVVSNFAGAWVVVPYKGMCLEMAGNFDYIFVVAPVYFDYHPFALRVLASLTCIITIPWFPALTSSSPTTGPMGAIPKIILTVITITILTLSGSWVIVAFITSPILSLWIPLFGGSCILGSG